MFEIGEYEEVWSSTCEKRERQMISFTPAQAN